MEFLPRSMGTRPRLACEVRAEGVVAARAEEAAGLLSAVSRSQLADGALAPGLKAGNIAVRSLVVPALRKALEAVSIRNREVTLVVPDAAARVLLLDFDALPGKAVEALPVVRFRLKKLLPFDSDDAAVSYQVMSSSKETVRVLAVAMPREVLEEYEAVVREAGFEPGAILPSTLAALAGLGNDGRPVLVVNAGRSSVTTAIVRAGVLLLHRTIDLATVEAEAITPLAAVLLEEREVVQAVSVAAAYFEDTLESAPREVLAAGAMGAEVLAHVLLDAGVGPVPVREMVDDGMLGPGAITQTSADLLPNGWLAGVRGALAN